MNVLMQRLVMIVIFFLLTGVPRVLFSRGKICFEHITATDGLSQNTIFSLFQDRNGFLWIGTEDGLNRYDGYDIKVYKKEVDSKNGLSSGKILGLTEDRDGLLWIATDDKVNSYNPRFDNFTPYSVVKKKTDSSVNNEIYCIFCDSEGNVWAGTRDGLFLYKRDNDRFAWWSRHRENTGFFLPVSIFKIFEDSKRVLWIAGPDGIFTFDYQKGKIGRYDIGPFKAGSYPYGKSPDNIQVKAIYEDGTGRLWIGVFTGKLYFFDPGIEAFAEYCSMFDIAGANGNTEIRVISGDRASPGTIWVGTGNSGLFIINPATRAVES